MLKPQEENFIIYRSIIDKSIQDGICIYCGEGCHKGSCVINIVKLRVLEEYEFNINRIDGENERLDVYTILLDSNINRYERIPIMANKSYSEIVKERSLELVEYIRDNFSDILYLEGVDVINENKV